MRVAVIADIHVDQHKRLAECERLLGWIHADCERRGVDLVLVAGDVYERKSTPAERLVASTWTQRMADLATVIFVRGNHDAEGDLLLLAKLEAAHPILVEEQAGVYEVAGALIACVAWPRKSSLLAATGADSRAGGEAMAAEALRNVLRGLGDELAQHDGPTMLLMHAMVRESKASTGQPLVGCDLEIGLEDLALARADAYFLGHIHAEQGWVIDSAPVIYPGSVTRRDFGELEAKGYVIAEWDDETGDLRDWQFIQSPATPMHHVDDEWRDGAWLAGAHGLPESCAGVELRFRYRVRKDERAAARAAAEAWKADWLAEGAVSVKIDERVILEQRTRSEAIPARAPLAEKVEAFWAVKKFAPGDRREALIAKLQQVEAA